MTQNTDTIETYTRQAVSWHEKDPDSALAHHERVVGEAEVSSQVITVSNGPGVESIQINPREVMRNAFVGNRGGDNETGQQRTSQN